MSAIYNSQNKAIPLSDHRIKIQKRNHIAIQFDSIGTEPDHASSTLESQSSSSDKPVQVQVASSPDSKKMIYSSESGLQRVAPNDWEAAWAGIVHMRQKVFSCQPKSWKYVQLHHCGTFFPHILNILLLFLRSRSFHINLILLRSKFLLSS